MLFDLIRTYYFYQSEFMEFLRCFTNERGLFFYMSLNKFRFIEIPFIIIFHWFLWHYQSLSVPIFHINFILSLLLVSFEILVIGLSQIGMKQSSSENGPCEDSSFIIQGNEFVIYHSTWEVKLSTLHSNESNCASMAERHDVNEFNWGKINQSLVGNTEINEVLTPNLGTV